MPVESRMTLQLVKWEGEAPLPRDPTPEERRERRRLVLSEWRLFRSPLRQWREGRAFIRSKIDPNPVGHPQCLEIVEAGDGHPTPVVTYRRS